MNCNNGIYRGLYDMGEIRCDFCNNDMITYKWTKKLDSCCITPLYIDESYG